MPTSTVAPPAQLAPTLLATAGLTYALVETMVFRAMLAAPRNTAGNELFGPFWRHFLPGGAALAVVCSVGGAAGGTWAAARVAGTGVTGLADFLLGGSSSSASAATVRRARLLAIGGAAALAHLAFVPKIAGIIDRIVNHPVDSREEVRRWLRTHYVRTLLTDAVAFACFTAAWFVE